MFAFVLIAACAHHRQDAVEREEEPRADLPRQQSSYDIHTSEDLAEAAARSKAYGKVWQETDGMGHMKVSSRAAATVPVVLPPDPAEAAAIVQEPSEEMLAQMDPELAQAIRASVAYRRAWLEMYEPILLPGTPSPSPKPNPSPTPTVSSNGSPLIAACPEGREPRNQAEVNGCLVKTDDAVIEAHGVDHPK